MKIISSLFFRIPVLSFFVWSGFLLANPSSQAKDDSGSQMSQLETFDSAANLLMAVADERMQPAQVCNISSEKAFSLMNPLHAKIDEAKDKYIKIRKQQKKRYSEDSWGQTCESKCHCVLYASTLEKVGFEHLQTEDQKAYRKLSSLAMNQTNEVLTACAKEMKDFCSSSLHKELQKEAN